MVERCTGLDVHQETVVACVLTGALEAKPKAEEVRDEHVRIARALRLARGAGGVTQVGMESTRIFWRPVWNVLEGNGYELVLANARKIKNAPGRKTDCNDAEWIAQLLRCGLVERSSCLSRSRGISAI